MEQIYQGRKITKEHLVQIDVRQMHSVRCGRWQCGEVDCRRGNGYSKNSCLSGDRRPRGYWLCGAFLKLTPSGAIPLGGGCHMDAQLLERIHGEFPILGRQI